MNISELCYELHKLNWKQLHVKSYGEASSIKEYYNVISEEGIDSDVYTYEDYIFEFGYGGSLYPCYAEFLDADYMDVDYIQWLLNDKSLFAEYMDDIEKD